MNTTSVQYQLLQSLNGLTENASGNTNGSLSFASVKNAFTKIPAIKYNLNKVNAKKYVTRLLNVNNRPQQKDIDRLKMIAENDPEAYQRGLTARAKTKDDKSRIENFIRSEP